MRLETKLTEVHKTHHHVGIVEKVGVVRRGERGALAQQRGRSIRLRHPGVSGVRRAIVTFPGVPLSLGTDALPRAALHAPLLLFLVQGHGVVQVEHEERRGGRLLAGREGPRTVRQAQDGEDLPLDLPSFVIAQPPVNKAGVHMVVAHAALGARQKAQAAPRQSEDGAAQRCKRCHLGQKPVSGRLELNYIARARRSSGVASVSRRRELIPGALIRIAHRKRLLVNFTRLQGKVRSPARKKSSSGAPDSTRVHPECPPLLARARPSTYGDVTPSLTLILRDARTGSYAPDRPSMISRSFPNPVHEK